MGNIAKNHDDWAIPEPLPTPTRKKRGILHLNPEDMQESKKSIKEKGINVEDVKKLPPIKKLCEPTTHPPMVEVHSLLDFNASDIPYGKPPDQFLDELDNFIMKQENFNKHVQSQFHYNSIAITNLHDVPEKTANDVIGLVKHFHMVQNQLEQINKVQIDLLANMSNPTERKTYGI